LQQVSIAKVIAGMNIGEAYAGNVLFANGRVLHCLSEFKAGSGKIVSC
jgi:hypothetical protein